MINNIEMGMGGYFDPPATVHDGRKSLGVLGLIKLVLYYKHIELYPLHIETHEAWSAIIFFDGW